MWVPAIALVAAAGSVAAAGGDADRYLLTRQEPYNQPGSATTAKVSPESLDSPAAAERGNSAGRAAGTGADHARQCHHSPKRLNSVTLTVDLAITQTELGLPAATSMRDVAFSFLPKVQQLDSN